MRAAACGKRCTGQRTASQRDTQYKRRSQLGRRVEPSGEALESTARERFTLLMQAVLSMDPRRDQMVEWLLSKGADPNAKNDRGDTAYQLAARLGIPSTMELLAKAGSIPTKEEWPKPAGGTSTAEAAVKKLLPLI